MAFGTIWISFVQTCLPQRRRVRRSYQMDAGLEQRALLSAVAGCELNVDAGDEVPDDTAGDVTPVEDAILTDDVDLAWCGTVELPADENATEDQTPIECDFLNPFDPVVELDTNIDDKIDTEVNPMVIRCFGPNPYAVDTVDQVGEDAGGDVATNPSVVEDPVDPANPEVPTDVADNPDVIFYSLGGGGRGTDDNGNIPPNFRGNNQTRLDRKQARKQEKASQKADRQAAVQQHKSNRAGRQAGRRHR